VEPEELQGSSEEVQQVIYIAYENSEQKAIEGIIKNGQIDISALPVKGIAVETDTGREDNQCRPLDKMEQMEYKDQAEPLDSKLVEETEPVEQSNLTIDLTMKDG